MTIRQLFAAETARRILIKDGPYGTAIQAYGLKEEDYRGQQKLDRDQKGNNDLLNLTQPQIIREICDRYIAAGASVLATNTFNANSISLSDYGAAHLVREVNMAAAKIIRTAVDAASARDGIQRFVCGALGPTNKTLSISPDVNNPGYREVDFDQVRQVYRAQIDALLEGGVDIILIETVFDTLNAKAAIAATLDAAEHLGRDVPMMLSMTLTDMAGRNLSGQTVEAFWHSVRHATPLSIGLNCSFGATELRPYVQTLARIADTAIMVYPNAGLPNDMGQYDEAPQTTAQLVRAWADEGLVNVVGGCCGTTAAHIAAIAQALADAPPRVIPKPAPALRLSGLEAFRLAS